MLEQVWRVRAHPEFSSSSSQPSVSPSMEAEAALRDSMRGKLNGVLRSTLAKTNRTMWESLLTRRRSQSVSPWKPSGILIAAVTTSLIMELVPVGVFASNASFWWLPSTVRQSWVLFRCMSLWCSGVEKTETHPAASILLSVNNFIFFQKRYRNGQKREIIGIHSFFGSVVRFEFLWFHPPLVFTNGCNMLSNSTLWNWPNNGGELKKNTSKARGKWKACD